MADPVVYINRAGLEQRFGVQEIAELLGETYPLVAPEVAPPAPSFVQSVKDTGAAGSAFVSPNVSEGNVLLAFIRVPSYDDALPPLTLSDSHENLWQRRGLATFAVNSPALALYRAVATESGTCVIEAIDADGGVIDLVVVEVSGTIEGNSVQVIGSDAGAPSIDLGTLPADQLVIAAAVSVAGVTLAPDAGFTAVDSYHTDGVLSVIRAAPSAGSLAAAWTGAGNWVGTALIIAPAEAEIIHAPKLNGAITDAQALVDSYVASKYNLPLVYAPTIVIGWAADIARFRLWNQRAPEEVRKRYDDVIAQMKELSKGHLKLPPDVNGVDSPPYLTSVKHRAPDRIFTPDTLAGY